MLGVAVARAVVNSKRQDPGPGPDRNKERRGEECCCLRNYIILSL